MLPGENVNADALRSRIKRCSEIAAASLLTERNASGFWTGELSSSALSTATALTALSIVDRARSERRHEPEIKRGLAWLAKSQNPDGSWGDSSPETASVEETALALETLAELVMAKSRAVQSAVSMFPLQRAIESAAGWLASRVEIGTWKSLRRSDFILRSFGITNGRTRKSSRWAPSMQPAVF